MSKKKEWICLIVGFLGAMLGLYGVAAFNQFVLMSLSLGLRMVSMLLIYWLIAFIPIIVMLVSKNNLADYGFCKDKKKFQIIVGILIGVAMSFILTLIPHLLGFGEYVDSGKRYKYLWQFIYEFFYCIFAVGFVEEFVFRGFVYKKIKSISQKDMIAIIISGLFNTSSTAYIPCLRIAGRTSDVTQRLNFFAFGILFERIRL